MRPDEGDAMEQYRPLSQTEQDEGHDDDGFHGPNSDDTKHEQGRSAAYGDLTVDGCRHVEQNRSTQYTG